MENLIQKLNLEDDFLFAKVMSDTHICRKVLEKILDIKIKDIVMPASQKTIDLLLESKGIRLDIYVNDTNGTVYNCEIQRGRKRELPKRSRYYQGSIDLDMISKGDPYENLQKSFVIFICTFDPFNKGRHIYTFQNTCKEMPELILGDETSKVFLNTKGKQDDIDYELKEFLEYIENTTDSFVSQAVSPLIGEIHKKVTEVKQSKEMEAEYMTLLQRDRENIELGLEKGALLVPRIIKYYNSGLSIEEISQKLNTTDEYVKLVIKSYEEEQ